MNIEQTYFQSNLAAAKKYQPQTVQGQDNLKAIRKVAEEFEASFIAQLLRPMFEGIESDTMFGGGHAENVFQDLMVDEYGKSVAQAGGIGLADSITNQLLRLQEGSARGA